LGEDGAGTLRGEEGECKEVKGGVSCKGVKERGMDGPGLRGGEAEGKIWQEKEMQGFGRTAGKGRDKNSYYMKGHMFGRGRWPVDASRNLKRNKWKFRYHK